jgi:nucleoside-diphosphate-sugar epimerase
MATGTNIITDANGGDAADEGQARKEISLIAERLGWCPKRPLRGGLQKTYAWIEDQVKHTHSVMIAS